MRRYKKFLVVKNLTRESNNFMYIKIELARF